MIITKKYIRKLEEYYRFRFPEGLKEALINQLGKEPEPYEYSDQDIWEQSRKIILSYRRDH
jgi:hypothetical protein